MSTDEAPSDYDAEVFGALVEPVRVLGIQRQLAIALWGIALMLVLASPKLSNWWVLLGAGALHGLLALLTRRDPDFLRILLDALRTPNRLEP